MANDRLFAQDRDGPFRFDEEVAEVFDDMIRRSVPGYSALVQMVEVFANRYAQSGSELYDLGCSLGAGVVAMRRGAGARPVRIVGVDNSAPMLERCRLRLTQDETEWAAPGVSVELRCDDVRQTPVVDASLVVMNFTLQFVPKAERNVLIERVYQALRPGGALLLSEKITFEDAREAAFCEDLHDGFRKHNGYTEMEISRKRAALEQVLVPEPEAIHRARLAQAGFAMTYPWLRCGNFASWLAVK